MKGWLAAAGIVGAAVLIGNHRAEETRIPPDPLDPGVERVLGDVANAAVGQPRQTPGMSDKRWCLESAEHWEANGTEVPDRSECQGQPMRTWRGKPDYTVEENRQWCLDEATRFEGYGIPTSGDEVCWGQPMRVWRSELGTVRTELVNDERER